MNVLLFLIAVGFLLVGHLFRTIRWRLFLSEADIKLGNTRPLVALSLGYVVNTVLPLRLGELVRAAVLAASARVGLAPVLATILFERVLDLAVVGLLALILLQASVPWALSIGALLLGLWLGLVGLALRRSPLTRRAVWHSASLFNSRIKTAILHGAYIYLGFFRRTGPWRRPRFWLLSAAMWLAYLASLLALAAVFDTNLGRQFLLVYGTPLSGLGKLLGSAEGLMLLAYLLLPVLLILAVTMLWGFNLAQPMREALRLATRTEIFHPPPQLFGASNFGAVADWGAYLDRYFQSAEGLLPAFEQRALKDARLLRVFQGGSGAVTALIDASGTPLIRKFATGAGGDKIAAQYRWLSNHAALLPLTPVQQFRRDGADTSYDMPVVPNGRDLFEAIHTMPLDQSTALLSQLVDRVAQFHDVTVLPHAEDVLVARYVAEKANANLVRIKHLAPDLFARDSVQINGRPFALSRLNIFAGTWLAEQFTARAQSTVHGDLTIDNIIVSDADWRLIDPNPDNIFQSPLLDWAKLLQSLHLGYEAMARDPQVSWKDGRLDVSVFRSTQYAALHHHYETLLHDRFGADIVAQVRLHEMVHYLRLIPYQFAKSQVAGLAFTAALCLLVEELDASGSAPSASLLR